MPTSRSVSPQSAEDRRASLRVRTRLPFQWQAISSREALEELIEKWGLTDCLETQQLLATIEGQLERALHDVRDPAVSAVLRLLDTKLDLIARSGRRTADRPAPAPVELDLSADGMGFQYSIPLTPGSLLGVHLVLPGYGTSGEFHLLCAARTTGAASREAGSGTVSPIQSESRDGHHLGVQFLDLSPAASRRLTRFVISARSGG